MADYSPAALAPAQLQQPNGHGEHDEQNGKNGGNGAVQPFHDYTRQEEEWDREGLLDPAWEKQQKKTFTAWCNSHLRKSGQAIELIEDDFRTGLKLMLLLEVISGEPLPKPDRGKMRFHKIANVNKALHFIESKGVRLVSIGAEEIVDGNVKMTLGLIWTIILRFAIQDINVEELSARDGLLLWCQRKTAPYPNVSVNNFHTSWKDGLAFCALIHRHRPDLIDYHSLTKANALHNLNLAFDVAERHLDIPRMLDAEDMANAQPDEKAVMTYVSCYYHAFVGQRKAETAAGRICRVLQVNRDNEEAALEYEHLATDIIAWIRRWLPILADRRAHDTLASANDAMEAYRDYRRREKPPRIEQKGRLETQFNTLQTRLRLSNRPAFLPNDAQLLGEVEREWQVLEDAEPGLEEWLLAEIMRLERLELLLEKFRRKCTSHEHWTAGKEAALRTDEDWRTSGVWQIKALRRRHEAFEADLGALQDRVDQIREIVDELANLRYARQQEVVDRAHRIADEWSLLQRLAVERRDRLATAEEAAEKLDGLQLEFAKRAASFNTWLEGAREDLADSVVVHDRSEIDSMIAAHDAFKSTLADADEEKRGILGIDEEIRALVAAHHLATSNTSRTNPYTDLTGQEIATKWNDVQALIPTRERELAAEQHRLEETDRLRVAFTSQANELGAWLEARHARVKEIGLGGSRLEQAIEQLQTILAEVLAKADAIQALEAANERMQQNHVTENRGCRYSMESLRVAFEQLQTQIRRTVNECENQILLRDSKGISEDQLQEFRASFNHFDKERAGLDADQLRAFLFSIGHQIAAGKEGDKELSRLLAQLDPNRQGRVSFEALLDYLTREQRDEDTIEQLVASFRVLATTSPKGKISGDELRRELPDDWARYCQQRMQRDPETGLFDYESFAQTLYAATTENGSAAGQH